MRRHQVLVESAFPQEGATHAQQPGARAATRGAWPRTSALDWITELDFEVPVIDGKIPDDVEYLYWVGCAGALEDRAKKATKAIAELLHVAGREVRCPRPGGGVHRRPGPPPGQRVRLPDAGPAEHRDPQRGRRSAGTGKKVIASCPHCFNTISREYPQLGGNYEVIHHTQLLARLVEDGKLTPVNPVEEKITYHDPCFLGRHNKVYTPPRSIIDAVPGTQAEEMHRCKGKGFCCGAGGARMWLEERTGKRINEERIDEALALDPDTVSTACPYCMVMLGDAVNAKKAAGQAKEPSRSSTSPSSSSAPSSSASRPANCRRRERGKDGASRSAGLRSDELNFSRAGRKASPLPQRQGGGGASQREHLQGGRGCARVGGAPSTAADVFDVPPGGQTRRRASHSRRSADSLIVRSPGRTLPASTRQAEPQADVGAPVRARIAQVRDQHDLLLRESARGPLPRRQPGPFSVCSTGTM